MAIKRNSQRHTYAAKRSSSARTAGGGRNAARTGSRAAGGSARGVGRTSGIGSSRSSVGHSSKHKINGYSTGYSVGTGAGKHSSARTSSRTSRTSRTFKAATKNQARPTSRVQKSAFWDKEVASLPASNGDILLTRRHFLYGAVGVGAVVAAGAGVKAYTSTKEAENAISVLTVPESAVTESTSLDEVENGGKITLSAEITLPYGTLMWATNDDIAALLLPTDTGSPLTTVSILRLSSGYYFSVLDQAVGSSEGFEIYDVRASSAGMVWTEVNILEGVWRIYGATLSDDASMGEPHLLDQDTSDWETPSIAICGSTVFWQVMPNTDGAKKAEASTVRCAAVTGGAGATSTGAGSTDTSDSSAAGTTTSASSTASPASSASSTNATSTSNYQVVLTSQGRMCTSIYASDNQITVTPRVQTSGTYYQLTVIDATTRQVTDTVILPQSMKPLEAGYGQTGFMFSFEGIYSYGDGIANLGTYAPKTDVRGGNYSAAEWFHFARTPSAPPCWCGNFLVVKSTRSVVGVDLESDTYFVLDSVSGSDSYGDYLASTGSRERILVFANVNDEALSGGEKYCSARIFTAS